jgi:D-alanyl-D-alanine dipeptidase
MKKFTLFSLTLLLFTACSSTKLNHNAKNITIPSETKQLLVVTTANWSTKEGELQRYEKVENHWKRIGNRITIVLGRNGLAWGKGLHSTPTNASYIKKEGDGKAPAGLFSLGNGFGYSQTNFKMNFPYAVYKTTDHCVDDSNSIWYNQIIDSTKVKKDYKSFEHMKLTNYLYKYGITVNHNPNRVAQAGSCIFVHIKSENGKGTAGCTAMREDKIVAILKWLKEEKKPLLLQLPKVEMVKVVLN